MGNRPQTEGFSFVDRAERTAVPGTVSGYPDQQTGRLAGRTDRALLKTLVWFGLFHMLKLIAAIYFQRHLETKYVCFD
jgi:hypothetical protein